MEKQPDTLNEFYKFARLAGLGNIAIDGDVIEQLEKAVEAGAITVDEAAERFAAYQQAKRNP